jgi:hypothetical protein
VQRSIGIASGFIAVCCATGQNAPAHHASAGLYERDGRASVRGIVESLQWRNPHVRFTLLVTDDSGEQETWNIEAGSVNTLERIGVDAELLAIGNFVEAGGSPGRNDRAIMFADTIVSSDGQASALNIHASQRYQIDDSARRS